MADLSSGECEGVKPRVAALLWWLPPVATANVRTEAESRLGAATVGQLCRLFSRLETPPKLWTNRPLPDAVAQQFGAAAVVGVELFDCAISLAVARIIAESELDELETIAILDGYAPLLDLDLNCEALDEHQRYFAHYTTSENIAAGLLLDFAAVELWSLLPRPLPEDLLAFLRRNQNDYDLHPFYRLPDLRQLRLDLSGKDRRSQRLLQDLLAMRNSAEPDDSLLSHSGLTRCFAGNPELLRSAPSWLEIELTHTRPDGINPELYPPLPINDGGSTPELPWLLVEKMAAELPRLALEADLSISLSGLGDPLLYTRLGETLERLLSLAPVRRLYIESWLLEGLDAFLASLDRLSDEQLAKVVVVQRLLAIRPESYRKLQGRDRLADALAAQNRLIEFCRRRGEGSFLIAAELLKVDTVEAEIPAFFDRYEAEGSLVRPLLSKFNRYIDILPERRVADLTPLGRDFCWHLCRDLFVTVGGRVPLCKQDPYARRSGHLSGDLSVQSLAQIYAARASIWSESLRCGESISAVRRVDQLPEQPSEPLPCGECDEWYTFNG